MILMLEDDADRLGRFARVVEGRAGWPALVAWRSARRMIREVGPFLPMARVISLDHDLEPDPGNPEDPGDGYEVVKHLCQGPPPCPVVIHTSNGTRADWMAGEFDLSGWAHRRVVPLGDDWIEAHWAAVVGRLLDQCEGLARVKSK